MSKHKKQPKKKKAKEKKRKEKKKKDKLAVGKLARVWERLNTNNEEKSYLMDNLAMLISSGMDVYSAVAAVESELRSKGMQQAVKRILVDVDSGLPLWQALQNTHLLPDHVIALIQVGEESGRLSENLQVIAAQQQKDRSFYSKIRSAMLYPVFVLALTIIIGLGVAWFILPRLSQVFGQLRVDPPLITRFFFTLGDLVGMYGSWGIPLLAAILFTIIYLIFFFPKTKNIGQAILFALPGIKGVIQNIELARMGYILGTLLDAGLPILDAIDALSDVARFNKFEHLYKYLKTQVEEGKSFQESFTGYKKISSLIPMPIQQMIIASEQSGNLSQTLLKIGETFEERSENATKNMAVILEPILLVIVWLGVVGVALAIILPIYSLIGGFDTSLESDSPPPQDQPAPQTGTIVEFPKETEDAELPGLVEEEVGDEVVEGVDEEVTDDATEEEAVEPTVPVLSESQQQVEILPTGVGYLNLRDEAATTGEIIATVKPGETYIYTEEQNDWYMIILPDGQSGWVSGQYVKVLNE